MQEQQKPAEKLDGRPDPEAARATSLKELATAIFLCNSSLTLFFSLSLSLPFSTLHSQASAALSRSSAPRRAPRAARRRGTRRKR